MLSGRGGIDFGVSGDTQRVAIFSPVCQRLCWPSVASPANFGSK